MKDNFIPLIGVRISGLIINRLLWKKYDFQDYGLIGDAYISLDFSKIFYFSDTGIDWSSFKNRILDNIDVDYYCDKGSLIESTDDLIEIIENEELEKICILTHPPNWSLGWFDFIKWRFLQVFRNFGKRILLKNSLM